MQNLDTNYQPSPALLRPSMEYALLLSTLGILVMVVTYYANIQPTHILNKILNWSIPILGTCWFVWHFKNKHNQGYLGFGQGVKLSFLSGLFIGLFTALAAFVFMTWITPDYCDMITEVAIREMQQKKVPDATIQASMPMITLFSTPWVVCIMMAVGSLISYGLIGLIVTAILKKERA